MTCAKTRVLAVVYARDGRSYSGTNDCRTPQVACPRLPGEGYEKCRTVCDQEGHAEVMALRAAGDQARGATLKVWGIGWHCRDCQERAFAAGVVAIDAPDARPLAASPTLCHPVATLPCHPT